MERHGTKGQSLTPSVATFPSVCIYSGQSVLISSSWKEKTMLPKPPQISIAWELGTFAYQFC